MPTHTVWSNGRKLGETSFELASRGNQQLGTFQPTTLGIELLPGITGMMPALFDFHALCQREGVDTADDNPAAGREAFARFEHAPEGKRVIAAAKMISTLELRDAGGNTLAWESILITDVDDILRLAAKLRVGEEHTPEGASVNDSPPIRYMISVTLIGAAKQEHRTLGSPASSFH